MEKIKKKLRVRTVVICVILGLIAVMAVSFVLFMLYIGAFEFYAADINEKLTYKKISHTELTREQRLEDFEYMCSAIESAVPYIYGMKDKYGFSFLDLKDDYRRMVEECSDDYQFAAVISSMTKSVPSCHSGVTLSDYLAYKDGGFYRMASWDLIWKKNNIRGQLDAYSRYLIDKQNEYNELGAETFVFEYTQGNYYLSRGDDELAGAELVSVNGITPEEYCVPMAGMLLPLRYDSERGIPYRAVFVLSDVGKVPAEAVLRKPDGSTAAKTLYSDTDICFSLLYKNYFARKAGDIAKDYEYKEKAAGQNDIDVEADKENGIAYFRISSVNYSDGEYVRQVLKGISGYDNIIIDLRGNSGGSVYFWEKYMYPGLYRDDAVFSYSGYFPDNGFTDRMEPGMFGGASFIKDDFTGLKRGQPVPQGAPECSRHYVEYSVSHILNGDKKLDYPDSRRVYYLCDCDTGSSADNIIQCVKTLGLGTVIGTDTAGEGITAGIFASFLPNSNLMYSYSPSVAVDPEGRDNSLLATAPDIYCGLSHDAIVYSRGNGGFKDLKDREENDDDIICVLNEIGKNSRSGIKDAA